MSLHPAGANPQAATDTEQEVARAPPREPPEPMQVTLRGLNLVEAIRDDPFLCSKMVPRSRFAPDVSGGYSSYHGVIHTPIRSEMTMRSLLRGELSLEMGTSTR